MLGKMKIFIVIILVILFASCSLVGDIEGSRPKTGEDTGPAIPAPGTPVVEASDGLLTVRWTAVEEAENYEVYVSTDTKPPATSVKTVLATTAVLDGLVNKTTYYIWIKAVNQDASSAFSPRGRGIPWPAGETPATPGRPVIIPGINQLTVNWEETGGASSYELYINTSTTRPPAPEIPEIKDKTSTVIQNLENDIVYYFWVRAVNSAGKSDYSPLEAGTPKIPIVAPAAPDKPVVTAGSRELAVSWQAVELAAVYEVWLGTSDNSAAAQKQGGDISDTGTLITSLDNETIYYVWIKAKNTIGTSGFSPPASAKPSAFAVPPETPAMPTAITGYRALDVTWPPAEGALSYELWTGTSNNPANAEKHGEDVTSTSVTLTGLVNGTTYYIWIKAKNSTGESGFSLYTSGTPSASAAPPSAPVTAPNVTEGIGQLTVSWQPVEGASVYEVWAGTTNNPDAAEKRGGDVSGLSAVITGLANNTTYYVRIKAKNSVGISGFSPAASGTPSVFAVVPQAPAAPSVSIGNGQIILGWGAVEGAMAYEIWLSEENNSASALKQGTDITASLSATLSGLSNGTMYYIWLKAKNSHGTSGFSPAANGKPIASVSTPVLVAANRQLSVSWTPVAGADQYEVFHGTGINPPQTASQTIDAPAATAAISGLVNGTTYNVWIRGKNASGTGTMSNAASAKPVSNMGAVTVNAGDGRLSVSWASVAGADQYEVYYSTANTMPENPAQTVSATTATISGLVNGTSYYVWVRGKNTNGTSNASSASGKPIATPGVPTLSPEYGQLEVTWTAVAGADEYEVYYGIGTPTTLATTTAGTTATITGLTGGTTYYIRLRAKNANGVSDFGPSTSAVPSNTLSPGLYRGGEKIGNQNLNTALTWISSNAASGDDYLIILGVDESVSPKTLSYSRKTVGITLMGSGGERTITLNANGHMFTVSNGVSLTLDENVTLVGRNANSVSLVLVEGELIMNEGAKISGNTLSSPTYAGNFNGGGIYIYSSGNFIMNGGTISGNTVISNNDETFGGGVFMNNGSFTMNGGIISGNTLSSSRYSEGGGVCIIFGNFTMNGGSISGNTATSGGGVYNLGTFRMSGGVIYGSNAATDIRNGGGAFYNYSGHIAQYGIFSGSSFQSLGNLNTSDNTVRVVDGVLLGE